MPLTKVRVPVSDIATISNGTSNVDIASSGADVTVDVSGNTIVTIGAAAVTVDDVATVTANSIAGESIVLSTSGGAAATIETDASTLDVGTTSAHALRLLANAVLGLTIGTDGKATLAVEGTGVSHLVTKAYVDAAAAAAGESTATVSSNGTITIPTSTDDLIVKWGQQAGSGQLTQVTFGTAFPNAIFIALASPVMNTAANSDGQHGVYNLQTTGFQINQANKSAATNPWCWIAIGY